MKKIIALLLAAIMVFSVTGCGKKAKAKNAKAEEYIEHELAYSGDTLAAYLPYEDGAFSTEYDDESEKLRNKILSAKDSKPTYETTYYISYKGDDSNDGKSPETAWKTGRNLIARPINTNVLFERGGVYRGEFKMKNNTFVGAYGEGPMPCLYGSLQNYADEKYWTEYEPGIWKFTLEINSDIGAITFDHGVKAAARVMNMQQLKTEKKEYSFFSKDGVAYLYLTKGNPATIHKDIEVTPKTVAITGCNKNVTIENLCIKYSNYGITTGGGADNVIIRNCEIGYIGGCLLSDDVRAGNGIEIWGNSKNITIENCWVYQCYDAGITNQCSTDSNNPNNTSYFENIKFNSNLIEFCQYPIEFFNSKNSGSYCKNMYYTNNILRFAGYQVFDPKVRHGSDSSFTAAIVLPWYELVYENFIISGNIMDTSYGYMVKGINFNAKGGATVYENKYLQQPQKPTYFWSDMKDPYPMVPSAIRDYPATCQSSFEEGVKKLDSNPKSIKFVE